MYHIPHLKGPGEIVVQLSCMKNFGDGGVTVMIPDYTITKIQLLYIKIKIMKSTVCPQRHK